MLKHFYALKNKDVIPVGAVFKDPQDGTLYRVSKDDTLNKFTKKVLDCRSEKGMDSITEEDLEVLIEIGISNTVSDHDLEKFFEQRSTVVGMSEAISVAIAITQQVTKGQEVPFNTRQVRASKCVGCPLHEKKSSYGFATRLVDKISGIAGLAPTEMEKSLGVCNMCGCGLSSKVRFDLNAIVASLSPEDLIKAKASFGHRMFEKCWIFNEALKSSNTKELLFHKMRLAGVTPQTLLSQYLSEKLSEAKK